MVNVLLSLVPHLLMVYYLKQDELLRMKANGNHTDPNAAYTNSWNARRSLNLLKFSLNRPMVMRHVDNDGDEEMEIDEEAVDRLCNEVGLQVSSTTANQCADRITKDNGHLGAQYLDSEEVSLPNICIDKQASELSDVIMEEGISEMEYNSGILANDKPTASIDSNFRAPVGGELMDEALCKQTGDDSAPLLPDSANNLDTEAENLPLSGCLESEDPSTIPCDISPILQPAHSVSPELISSSRKSLKSLSKLTASRKDLRSCELEDARASVKSLCRSSNAFNALSTNSGLKSAEQLAASLHHGLEILCNHRQSSPFRRSALSFSLRTADSKPFLPIPKVDVAIQTSLESTELSEEDGMIYLCSNCKNRPLQGDLKEANDIDPSNLQLVPMDRSLSIDKPKKQVPKVYCYCMHHPLFLGGNSCSILIVFVNVQAVEKVLAGAIRREMALEDLCAKQISEIAQLNRLVRILKRIF